MCIRAQRQGGVVLTRERSALGQQRRAAVKARSRVEKQVDQRGVQVLPGDQVDRWGDDANILPRDHLREVEEPLWNE
jgi:hypothetical protein